MLLNRILLSFFFVFILFTHGALASDYYQNKLNSILPDSAVNNDNLGVYVESLTSGKAIAKYNQKKSFIPASNNKVITSFAALNLLGKAYRYKTSFYSGGEITNGTVFGGMYIKASGDPSIDTERLEAIVKDFKEMGIKEIKGNLNLDDSFFDDRVYGDGWKEDWRGDYYCPPIGAFSLNYNTIDIKVSPGKIGKEARIEVFPETFKVRIVNNAETSYKSSSLSAKLDKNDEYLTINGRINHKSAGQRFTISINNPTRYFGVVFSNMLVAHGIEFEGDVMRVEIPKWATRFYSSNSSPLHEIITHFNKDSINIIGEALVKTIGANFSEEPGTWENGAKVITDYLKSRGMKEDIIYVDGSGLSKHNSVSPYLIVKVLADAYKSDSYSKEFVSSLPVSGVDGTLKRRFRERGLRGRIMAKTGYLNGVRALSGFVKTNSGEVLAFSIISNGLGWKAKAFQNDLLSELVDCCKR